MCIKRLTARVFDIRNAFRVLDIMDKCGCDIDRATNVSEDYPESWIIKPKWYVTEQDAKDLQKIVLNKSQFRRRSKLWYKLFFKGVRYGCRPSECWYHNEEQKEVKSHE